MKDLPKRKNIRLREYDYSSNGVYFLTVCTENRRNLFADVVGAIHESPVPFAYPQMRLNPYGCMVEDVILSLPDRFRIRLNHYVIMPNHVHLLIENRQRFAQNTTAKTIHHIKIGWVFENEHGKKDPCDGS